MNHPAIKSVVFTPAPRPLHVIAAEIRKTRRNNKGAPSINYAAAPYLDAMSSLNSIDDMYLYDTAKSIVLYFLGNAQSWRGDDARRIKAELKALAA
jgi:hypothetical protein